MSHKRLQKKDKIIKRKDTSKRLECCAHLVVIGTAVITAVCFVLTHLYSLECSDFYGISHEYFLNKDIILERLLVFGLVIAYYLVIILCSRLGPLFDGWSCVMLVFMAWVLVLPVSIEGAVMIISFFKWNVSHSAENVLAGFIMFLSVVFSIGMGTDEKLLECIKLKRCQKRFLRGLWIFSVVFCVVLYSPFVFRAANVMTSGPEKKQAYEFLDGRAVVSKYDGSFVLMDCEIVEGTLVIKKGRCIFKEIPGSSLIKRTFNNVICQ